MCQILSTTFLCTRCPQCTSPPDTAAAMWPTYQPLMRADFMLFDEYEHGCAPALVRRTCDLYVCNACLHIMPRQGMPLLLTLLTPLKHCISQHAYKSIGSHTNAPMAPPFNFPITAFWGVCDQRISEHMVAGWSRFTTGPFELRYAGRVQMCRGWDMQAPAAESQQPLRGPWAPFVGRLRATICGRWTGRPKRSG